MGLIKAAVGAIGSTLGDQWKEAIRCPEMGNEILMMKKTTPNGVITNKSTIIVGPGQVALIYDNGKIVDATAEEGVYEYDESSTPSLFAGEFGAFFKEMWQRFTYNGATAKEQAVYFFNIKEIIGNKFGTPNPVPYKDWGHPIMNARTNSYIAMSVKIRCFGTYTFKITDPFMFMSKIAGLSDVYRKDDLVEQMRAEVIGSFSNVLNGLGSDKYKIEALELPNKTDEIKQIMDQEVFDQPIRERGIKLVSFIVESLTLDEESEDKIDKYEIGGDAYQQQGTLVGAYSDAVTAAASNPNGAMNGFMGIGMMNMTTGGMFNGAASGAFNNAKPMAPNPSVLNTNPVDIAGQPEPTPVKPQSEPIKEPEVKSTPVAQSGVACTNCGEIVTGNFCGNCGTPAIKKKFCTNCGIEVPGNFCTNCGKKA